MGKGIFITEPYGYDIYNDKPIINDIGNDMIMIVAKKD
jgi:ribosomal protection tetracycline resistance protein